MSDLMNSFKKAWLKTISAIGDTANNLADSAKTRTAEMNLSTNKKELLLKLGGLSYELWINGETFPNELVTQFEGLKEIDAQLAEIAARKKEKELEKKRSDQHPEISPSEHEEIVEKTKEVLKTSNSTDEEKSSLKAATVAPEKEAAKDEVVSKKETVKDENTSTINEKAAKDKDASTAKNKTVKGGTTTTKKETVKDAKDKDTAPVQKKKTVKKTKEDNPNS